MKTSKIIYWALTSAVALFFIVLLNNSANHATPALASARVASAESVKPEEVITVENKSNLPVTVSTDQKSQSQVQPQQVVENTDPITPTSLKIDSLGVNAPVLSLGLTSDGKMAVPNNFTEVGWYSLGVRPGEIGNAVLDAHVDNGSNIAGVFKHLRDLKTGDDIVMTDAQGKTLHFRVTSQKIYDYREQNTTEVFGSTGKSQLVLITCHGTFLPQENTYNQRLVVFAELVK